MQPLCAAAATFARQGGQGMHQVNRHWLLAPAFVVIAGAAQAERIEEMALYSSLDANTRASIPTASIKRAEGRVSYDVVSSSFVMQRWAETGRASRMADCVKGIRLSESAADPNLQGNKAASAQAAEEVQQVCKYAALLLSKRERSGRSAVTALDIDKAWDEVEAAASAVRAGNRAKAIEALDRALPSLPNEMQLKSMIANLLLLENRPLEAIAHWKVVAAKAQAASERNRAKQLIAQWEAASPASTESASSEVKQAQASYQASYGKSITLDWIEKGVGSKKEGAWCERQQDDALKVAGRHGLQVISMSGCSCRSDGGDLLTCNTGAIFAPE